ncbi:F-box protein at1g67340 [Phtheirospermum japonicum]|uniref:F-box protein at1g67340 n=1 Tax=Phtheirospermum japonicum TaxID=374723 RepID=A0A830C0F1_9LAMI|nr:F-box protein at1g67340 [Phtheirospermum japonicum]
MNRGSEVLLMVKATIGSQASALYSLTVIQINDSGGPKNNKDLHAGIAFHCLQDDNGVKRNVSEGRRFLIQANTLKEKKKLSLSLAALSSSSSRDEKKDGSEVRKARKVPAVAGKPCEWRLETAGVAVCAQVAEDLDSAMLFFYLVVCDVDEVVEEPVSWYMVGARAVPLVIWWSFLALK